jgi:pimeloyl-ACP methyl ester carboxylesterase
LAQTERAQLRAPTVVGHGLTALLALEVARRLKSRPRNVILLAGAVPSFVASPTEAMPLIARLTWWAHLMRPGTPSGAIRLHREAALRIFCKGMSYPEAGMHVLGKLGPIPIHMLDALPHPGVYSLGIPITYVALKQDGVMPYKTQRQAAGQLNALWTELDASHEAPITHAHAVADILLGKVKAEPLPRPEAAAA